MEVDVEYLQPSMMIHLEKYISRTFTQYNNNTHWIVHTSGKYLVHNFVDYKVHCNVIKYPYKLKVSNNPYCKVHCSFSPWMFRKRTWNERRIECGTALSNHKSNKNIHIVILYDTYNATETCMCNKMYISVIF